MVDDLRVLRLVVEEPAHPVAESTKALQGIWPQGGNSKERNQSDHRPDSQGKLAAITQVEHVVVEALPLVPQSHLVHRRRDVGEVLEELDRHLLVGAVVLREQQGELEHVQAEHGHPCSPVGLLQVTGDRQGCRAVDRPDVVQAQKAALEDVVSLHVLAVNPPGEIQQELVEDRLQEFIVAGLIDLEDADRRRGVHRRVHVREGPLVGGQLSRRRHVPGTGEELELVLGQLRVDMRQRDAMKCEVPGRKPRILPLVRHRDHVLRIEVAPPRVAARPVTIRGRRAARITIEPAGHVVLIELLGPEHPAEGLAHHARLVGAAVGWREQGVEGVGLALSRRQHRAEARAQVGRAVAQPEPDLGGLAGADSQVVQKGGLGPGPLRVYG